MTAPSWDNESERIDLIPHPTPVAARDTLWDRDYRILAVPMLMDARAKKAMVL